ncbi:MAG TPA: TraB/GumN family protein [Marinospirillum sp.]|uniref:TraB/GumN family protein n=1 Tax=Marinospirillum sp. TaxID=2183934 RepID=UPI002B49C6C5|nr:TraB/GumN family protein [Marinospirillum sp.]HKM14778.1 TraB/GumN family protein [Marinospirillum sp.]
MNTSQSNESSSGPRKILHKYNTEYTLLGTAHVSKASADEVRQLIQSGEFDAVAIELCPARFASLKDPDALAKLDLFQVIKQGKAGMVAANLALGSFQQRVAEESGIAPGAEMQAAIEEADKYNLPLLVIDRDVGITLKRVYRSVPWWQRAGLIMGLFTSLFSKEKVSAAEIEKLKEGDILEATFSEFAAESAQMYQTLVAERDHYMALRLAQDNGDSQYKKVLVVIGAGHLKGLSENLNGHLPENPTEQLAILNSLPDGNKWLKFVPWLIVALILSGFVIGFSRDTGLGTQMVIDWVLINGGLSALGVLIAGGHPLTILTAFVAAPLTSLNPTIGAGFVAAAAELYFRKPKVADFSTLRQDTANLKGWWKNRVSRTLLVFILATLGSAIGTYVGGFHIYDQLTKIL